MLLETIHELKNNYNEVIIGAGLIGLKTAQDIKKAFPENKILFLDIEKPENLKELNKIGDTLIINWGEKEFMKEVSKKIGKEAKIYICISTKGDSNEDYLFADFLNKYFSNNPIIVRSTFDTGFFYSIESKSKAVVPERYSPGDNLKFKLTYWSTERLKSYIEKIFKVEYSPYPIAVILSKIFENTQRYILISLMNSFEMYYKNLCSPYEIEGEKRDIFNEIIRICELKDNFAGGIQPGLIGGECIGVDNKYLNTGVKPLWKAADNINEDYYQYKLNYLKKIIFEFLDKTDNHGEIVLIGGEYKDNVKGKGALKNSPKYKLIMDLKSTLEKLFRKTPLIINTINSKTSEELSYKLNTLSSKTLIIVITKHDYIEEELKKLNSNYNVIYLK